MKFLIICFSFVGVSGMAGLPAHAQSVGVKDISATEDTTIKIQKGTPQENTYEITTNVEAIEGEAAPLLKEARANWKAACKEWKKELKELNKENQLISANCGSMKCSTTSMETTCVSEGTSKVKVKLR